MAVGQNCVHCAHRNTAHVQADYVNQATPKGHQNALGKRKKGMPVQDSAEYLERQSSDANEAHQPLSLQFLQRWQSLVDDLQPHTPTMWVTALP